MFLKVFEIKTKEGKKYFKCDFLTEDLEYHNMFISADLMQKCIDKGFKSLGYYKATFKEDKEMKLHLVDIN